MSVVIRVRAFKLEDLNFPIDEDLSDINLAETVKQYNVEMDEALEAVYPDAIHILENDYDDPQKDYITIEGVATEEEEIRIRGGVAYVRDLARRLAFNEMAVVEEQPFR